MEKTQTTKYVEIFFEVFVILLGITNSNSPYLLTLDKMLDSVLTNQSWDPTRTPLLTPGQCSIIDRGRDLDNETSPPQVLADPLLDRCFHIKCFVLKSLQVGVHTNPPDWFKLCLNKLNSYDKLKVDPSLKGAGISTHK